MRYLVQIVMLIASIGLVACGGAPVMQDMPTTGVTYSEEEYLIGVGDQLDIRVWRNPDLSTKVPVRPDGRISAPLVGDVMAAGISAQQLSKTVKKKLAVFIRNPQVTVLVTDPSSSDFQQRVRVTGAVEKPKSLAYRDGMTILDLVLEAGGPNKFAVPNKTKLYRTTKEGTKIYKVLLDDILKKGRLQTNYRLLPSDILTIPERSL